MLILLQYPSLCHKKTEILDQVTQGSVFIFMPLSPKNFEPWQTNELRSKMKGARMPWPGDEGENRWHRAWQAIKKVLDFEKL